MQEETINKIFHNINELAKESNEAVTTLEEVQYAVHELNKKKCKTNGDGRMK